MKFIPIIFRVLLGLMFVFSGANILHPFGPPPPMPSPDSFAGHFYAAMMPSGYMKVVGGFQLLGGLLLLFGGTVPLGLVILCPILVNILLFHLLLMGGQGVIAGAVCTLFALVLIYFYRASFSGILTVKATPTV